MSQRQAVTKSTAARYRAARNGAKAVILDELCQTTGWHRDARSKPSAVTRQEAAEDEMTIFTSTPSATAKPTSRNAV